MQAAAQKILTWEKLTNGKVGLISDFVCSTITC